MRIRIINCILFLASELVFSSPALAQSLDEEEALPVIIGTLIFLTVVILISIFIFGVIRANRKVAEEERKFYRSFALNHGFKFFPKDTLHLAHELEGTPFEKKEKDPENFLKNILFRHEHDSDCYVFYRNIPPESRGSTSGLFTVSFFSMKKSSGLNMMIKTKSPVILKKTELSLRWGTLTRIDIPNENEFNREFIIYADKEPIAKSLINKDIIEYCRNHRKYFAIPNMIYTEIKENKLMIYAGHAGLEKVFKNKSQLEKFINFVEGLKGKLSDGIREREY